MTIYVLLWSFVAPHTASGVYVEAMEGFASMEACSTKLAGKQYYLKEGTGECQKVEVSK